MVEAHGLNEFLTLDSQYCVHLVKAFYNNLVIHSRTLYCMFKDVNINVDIVVCKDECDLKFPDLDLTEEDTNFFKATTNLLSF